MPVCVQTVTESKVSRVCYLITYSPILHLLDSHKILYQFITYSNTIIHPLLQMEHTAYPS